MDRSLFLLILVLGGVWLILDDVYGKRTLSRMILSVIPNSEPKLGTPEYYQQHQTWKPSEQSNAPTYEEGKRGVQQPTGGQMG